MFNLSSVKVQDVGSSFNRASLAYSQNLYEMTRLTPGKIRSQKEKLAVNLLKTVIKDGVVSAGLSLSKLKIKERDTVLIPFDSCDYFDRISEKAANNLIDNLELAYTKIEMDLAVYYEDMLFLAIESKAYAENTMLKKFVFESDLIKRYVWPRAKFVIFQLENGFGGDYSEDIPYDQMVGSLQTHSLISRGSAAIKVITMLPGVRDSKKPIHTAHGFKPLSKRRYERAVSFFAKTFNEQCSKKHFNFNER